MRNKLKKIKKRLVINYYHHFVFTNQSTDLSVSESNFTLDNFVRRCLSGTSRETKMAATSKNQIEYVLSSVEHLLTSKSIYHVKLTDSSLKSIEDFLKQKKTAQKPTIHFEGSSGVLSVPDGSAFKTFEFSLSAISNDPNGNTECVKQDAADKLNSPPSFLQLGTVTSKITVHANDDVYQSTKEKMTLVEEESKKSCAKEIKSSDPKGKRIVKKIAANHSLSRIAHVKANTKPEVVNNTVGSVPKPSSGIPVTSEYSLKDRIIHLLALRPYKRVELLARLMRDGLRENEKINIDLVLAQVAQNIGDSYTLAKHVYSAVRSDWPFYSDWDKQLLKRRIVQETNVTKAPPPAISPVHSNHGSPMNNGGGGQKRASDVVNMENMKKPRMSLKPDEISNKRNPVAKQNNAYSECNVPAKLSDLNVQMNGGVSGDAKQTSNASLSSTSLSEPIPLVDGAIKSDSVCEDQNDLPDYVQKYVTITTDDQRQQYKKDFHLFYAEYMRLHGDISTVAQKFKQLKKELQDTQEGSTDYIAVKNKILHEYKREKSDERYMSHRKRFHHLHAKLNHIKQLIVDYDKASASACT